MIQNNNLYEKAFDLAKNIIVVYRVLCSDKKEWVLSKQLLRSGTSIGANIAEANGAISKADFSAKISISYKESLETKYWLTLMHETELLDKKTFNDLNNKADELSRIMFSILKKTRINSYQ